MFSDHASDDGVLPPAGRPLRSDLRQCCSICLETEKALLDFMSRRQYELAKSEDRRLEHAERGGFCALHTWQYEALASPQGIRLAYLLLLDVLARRLRALLGEAPSSGFFVEGVKRLQARAGDCETCRCIEAAEKTAAARVLSAISAGDSLPSLCLRHLVSVLHADPEPEIARLLVEEQSRVLERLAEEMRRYSLKHESHKREAATDLERQAHEIALSRLAGFRSIVKP